MKLPLGNSRSIKKLIIKYNQKPLDAEMLGRFSNLEEVQLFGKGFDDTFVTRLKDIRSIRRIHLIDNDLNCETVEKLLKGSLNVTHVNLLQDAISPQMIEGLRKQFPAVVIDVQSDPADILSMHH